MSATGNPTAQLKIVACNDEATAKNVKAAISGVAGSPFKTVAYAQYARAQFDLQLAEGTVVLLNKWIVVASS